MSVRRGEQGFTLVELLVSMTLGLLITFAAFMLLDNSVRLSKRTSQRTDAAQRGRLALDLITRELRAEVCLTASNSPLVDAQNSSIIYYVNLSTVDATPEKHQLAVVGGDIVLQRWVANQVTPTIAYPVAATSTKTVLENVEQVGTTPIFSYYAWGAGATTLPDVQLTPPLSAAELAIPVKIGVGFRVLPGRDFRNTDGSATLQDSVFMRSADPSDPTHGPRCS